MVQVMGVDRQGRVEGAAADDAAATVVGKPGGGTLIESVYGAAAAGVAGASAPLPHGDAIQASFGHHDVSHVRAQVGGDAAAATAAIGAEAYATGDRVAFGSAPDLHTAAHEAAHVVQQRAGVSLYGGVGEADDPYEQHADRVADAVVAGRSAEALLDAHAAAGGGATTAIQKKDTKKQAPLAFARADQAPGGTAIVEVQVELARLPADLTAAIGPVDATVGLGLYVDGDQLALAVRAGAAFWVARANPTEVIQALVGSIGAAAMEKLGPIQDVLAAWRAKSRVRAAGGAHVRIDLWGVGAEASFVVIDLASAAASVAHGSAAGFRPLEAKVELGKAGGVSLFGGDQVKAEQALPTSGLVGEWFDVPDPGGAIKSVVGGSGDASVRGAVFYDGGVLSVAVRERDDAPRGAVAHVDLVFLLEKLKALGSRALSFLDKLIEKVKQGARNLFNAVKGLLRFDLPELGGGSWLQFDLTLQLPRLLRGGHFDLSSLWPTGFHFALPGVSFGALPKLSLPWLSMPRLGGFRVPWDRLKGLIGELPGVPKLPSIELDLHFISDLRLGLALDLSKLWPDFGGGDAWFSFELDLGALLDAVAGAGHFIADKLRKLKTWFQHWVHLGGDGVLRLYDDRDDNGPMLGFHLLRLLDGVQPSDLAPTEIRWTPGKQGTFGIEVGEAAPEHADPKAPARKAAPKKPKGTAVMTEQVAATAELAQVLALAPGAPVDLDLYWDPGAEQVTAWAESPSAVYDRAEAVKMTIGYAGVADAVAKRLPGGGKAPSFPAVFQRPAAGDLVTFAFGDAARPAGDKRKPSGVSGHVGWKLSRLIDARDLLALVPDQLDAQVDGVGGVELGKIHPPGDALGDRFEVAWGAMRKDVLHAADDRKDVWAGVHAQGDLVALSITKEHDGDEGVLAQVHVSFLLRQLEKLGKLGERILDGLIKAFGVVADKASSFADKIARVAGAIGQKLLRVIDGLLQIQLPGGGGWIGWNLKAHLPDLGLHFDWSKLVPEFEIPFDLGGGHTFSLSWLSDFKVGGLHLPAIPLPALRLGKLLDGLPGLDLSKVKDLRFLIGWLPDMSLDVGIDLSGLTAAFPDLFGGGSHWLGFKVPLGKLVEKLQKLGAWAKEKLGKVGNPLDSMELGQDGILRIFDQHNVIGFDLWRLLDGIDPSDLVPVELKTEVDNKKGDAIAELAYGTVAAPDAKAPGHKVLAQRPRPTAALIAHAAPTAPDAVRDYLGAAPDAKIDVSLYTQGADAILFAALPHSDHGVELILHYDKLASAADNVGPIKAPGGNAVTIDKERSKAKGSLVVTFGPKLAPGAKPAAGAPASGYLAWRLEHLLGAKDLSALVPDELHVANDKGELTAGTAIPLAGLAKVASFPVPSWAQQAVGAESGEIWAAHHGDLRVALVEKDAHPNGTARGVELDLAKPFVDKIEHRLTELVTRAQAGIGHALRRAGRDAGQDPGKRKSRIALHPSSAGVVVERGKDADPDHMYATFGWDHVARLASGELTVENLMPVEFRVATRSAAIEMKDEAGFDGEHPPQGARKVGRMHELIRGPLEAIGVLDAQWLMLDRTHSAIEQMDPATGDHRVKLVADLFDVNVDSDDRDQVTITGAKQITASVSLEAVLAQVVPRARKLFKKKDPAAAKKPSRVSAQLDMVDDLEGTAAKDPGITLSVNADISSAKTQRSLGIQAGWTIEQLIELVMRMADVIDDDGKSKGSTLGLLAPTTLQGSFTSEKYRIKFGMVGHHSEYNCSAKAVPGMVELLSEFLDDATAKACIFNLDIPSQSELVNKLKDALTDTSGGTFIPLAGANVEVPHEDGNNRFYGFDFEVSPAILINLAGFIPEIGIIVKLAQAAINFLKHPGQTLEDLEYTPELMYHFVKNLPDIVDNMKGKSWKEIAVGLLFGSDATNKQLVMGARLYEKLKSNPDVWKKIQAMKEKGAYSDLAGVSADKLKWLAEQDPGALERMFAYGKILKDEGIDVGDENKDFVAPDHPLDAQMIDAKIMLVQAGYEQYAAEMDQAAQDKKAGKPVDQAKLDAHAKALHDTIAKFTGAGAKPTSIQDPRKADPSAAPPDIKPPEQDLTNVSGMPEPSDDQIAQAQKIYLQGVAGANALNVERDYMIRKYAALSTDQLGELLTSGSTSVTTRNGPVQLQMPESERDFVRSLFLLRVDPHAQVLAPGEAVAPKLTDAELVKRWQSGAYAGKGVQPGQDTPTHPSGAKDGKKGDGKGGAKDPGAGGGGPAGDAGTYQEGDPDADGGADADYVDVFGDEKDLAAGKGGKGKGDGDKDGADSDIDIDGGGNDVDGAAPAQDDQHLVSMTADQMSKTVIYDAKKDTMVLAPGAVAGWKAMKGENSKGQQVTIADLRLAQVQRGGSADSPKFGYVLEFDVAFDKKVDHTEKIVAVYQKKGDVYLNPISGGALQRELHREFAIQGGKVVATGKGTGTLDTGGAKLAIRKLNNAAPDGGGFTLDLRVHVVSATPNYMLQDPSGDWFYLKDHVDEDIDVLVPFAPDPAAAKAPSP
jgi:hypothetical protein